MKEPKILFAAVEELFEGSDLEILLNNKSGEVGS
jgi:hypothetical protein